MAGFTDALQKFLAGLNLGQVNDPNANNYMPEYEDALRQNLLGVNQLASSLDTGEAQAQQDYGRNTQLMKDQQAKALDSLSNKFASNGLLRSGNYLNAQGDLNTDYQNRSDALNLALTRGSEDRQNQLGQAEQTFNTGLTGLQNNRAQWLAQKEAERQQAAAQAAADAQAAAAQQAAQQAAATASSQPTSTPGGQYFPQAPAARPAPAPAAPTPALQTRLEQAIDRKLFPHHSVAPPPPPPPKSVIKASPAKMKQFLR